MRISDLSEYLVQLIKIEGSLLITWMMLGGRKRVDEKQKEQVDDIAAVKEMDEWKCKR